MKVPSYLQPYAADYSDNGDNVTINIADSKGGRLFEIWYYGEYADWCGLYVSTEECGEKFVARSVETGEDILLFDAALHGYDPMFCIEPEEIPERPLKKLDVPPTELRIDFGYSIDYDSEKDIYNFDSDGRCILINGDAIPWEQVKTDGIDWITIYYKNENGSYTELTEMELS